MFIISNLFVWWAYRIGFQGPSDEPIIFNRKTRTVTAYHVSVPNVFKVKRRPEVRTTTCSWDLVKVRTYRTMASTGGATQYRSRLAIVWGDEDKPDRFNDYANLGSDAASIDDVLFILWEHIRRYMEEDGPAIRQGEELCSGFEQPCLFPQDVLDTLGGPALTREEAEALAAQSPE